MRVRTLLLAATDKAARGRDFEDDNIQGVLASRTTVWILPA